MAEGELPELDNVRRSQRRLWEGPDGASATELAGASPSATKPFTFAVGWRRRSRSRRDMRSFLSLGAHAIELEGFIDGAVRVTPTSPCDLCASGRRWRRRTTSSSRAYQDPRKALISRRVQREYKRTLRPASAGDLSPSSSIRYRGERTPSQGKNLATRLMFAWTRRDRKYRPGRVSPMGKLLSVALKAR